MTTPLYDHVSFESSGISLWSHLDSPLTEEMTQKLLKPHTSTNYFLMFVNHSLVHYCVDLKNITVSAGQVLFIKPRQIRIPPSSKNKAEYYKVIFNEEIYGLLPSSCRFWLDPLNEQKVAMSTQAWQRMNDALMLLRTAILTSAPLNIRMAYLNSVLQELEHAYFSNVENEPKKRHVQSFLHFQTLIENKFIEQLTISEIAKTLALSDTSLYQLVKEWAGVSPKEYLNRRIVLEAQRLLIYSNLSVKELAVRLGFADENYLSRFFRKQTGQSITDFLVKFKDMSSQYNDLSLCHVSPFFYTTSITNVSRGVVMKSVLITGANQGIGLATAKNLAHQGYYVYLACRNPDAGTLAVEILKAEGIENASCVLLDVTDQASIDLAVKEVLKHSNSLDALINNAGILGNFNPDGSVSIEEIKRVFETNVYGVIRVTRAFLPLLQQSNAPRIVHISSGLGSLTNQSDPDWLFSHYKSEAYFPSKTALNAYCVALAAKLKSTRCKVNVVDPGFVKTAFNGFHGIHDPAEAAKFITYAATLPENGPTGCFLSESEGSSNGIMPW